MKLWSDSFRDGDPIPGKFAFCVPDPRTHVALSDNVNPHLAWDQVPAGTRSLVLLCHDPDVPSRPDDVNREDRSVSADLTRMDFFHWVLIDLPPELRSIAAGACSRGVTPHGKGGPATVVGDVEVRHGFNDYTGWFANDHDMQGDYYGYDGPCPPWNDELVHQYVFTLYALDVERLAVTGRFGGVDARRAMQGHVLGEARLIGTYTLNPALR